MFHSENKGYPRCRYLVKTITTKSIVTYFRGNVINVSNVVLIGKVKSDSKKCNSSRKGQEFFIMDIRIYKDKRSQQKRQPCQYVMKR